MSKFYEELIRGTFLPQEKVARTQQDVKDTLKDFSNDQIEALAEELGLFAKEAEETVEEKATEQARREDGQAEKDLRDSSEDSSTDGVKSEDQQKKEQEAADTSDLKRDDDNEDEKKKEVESPIPADAKKDDEEYELKSATLEELLQDDDFRERLAADAYELVGAFLKQASVSVNEYVFSKVKNRTVANSIAQKAEQIAAASGKPVLQVADDLISSVIQKAQQ